ncbi:MAG: polymer-forming cytoskeletal protein [Deltaproteobacteria bacterium]|nr:polymer-forming cytoskeletal protein [Deltaproteobacteria bacterium]
MAREEKQTGEINALLGRGASFEGKLSFEGTVRIDGNFKGEIFTDDILVIGDGAKVEAEIRAGSVNVNGEVKGNIVATKSVDLHRPARVYGNINTPAIEIEKGVIFEGNCSMKSGGAASAKPVSNAKPAEGEAQKNA